jgi:hypothetical protein
VDSTNGTAEASISCHILISSSLKSV